MGGRRVQRGLDHLAVAASGICTMHCLLGPLSVVLFPVLATCGVSEGYFHRLLAFLVFPTSLVGLALGCSRHKDRVVLALGVLGLAAIGGAVAGGQALLGAMGERAVTLLGGLTAASAHVRNFRLCRDRSCHHETFRRVLADPDEVSAHSPR